MKSKYHCNHCKAAQDRKHVEAMIEAGFSLNMLNCRECGQQAVRERVA